MRCALSFLTLSACRIQAAFECDVDEQCRDGERAGTCQLDSFCSFPDGKCTSGQRYADNAGDGLAGMCIGGTIPDDDASVDAPTFDTSLCPATYNKMLGAGSTSRYRLITSTANVWTQAATCKADLPGATHLVVLDDMTELAAVRAALPLIPFPPLFVYVGVVQDPAASDPDTGWIHFDGRPVSGLWGGTDPDNNETSETMVHENVAETDILRAGIHDTEGTATKGAFCECDGIPVHPMAQAFLDGDPSKP